MRTTSLLVTAVLLAAPGAALAQPGAAPPPPPYGYAPQPAQLTPEEYELLAEGEISDGAHAGGGLLAVFVGFGLGQAVQGRWDDTGWIFTVGEIGAIALIVYGAERQIDDCYDRPGCDDDRGTGAIVVGALGFVVFRIAEMVDAFAGPARHNRRVRDLRMRLGYPPHGYYYGAIEPYVAPTGKDDGAVAGLRLRF